MSAARAETVSMPNPMEAMARTVRMVGPQDQEALAAAPAATVVRAETVEAA